MLYHTHRLGIGYQIAFEKLSKLKIVSRFTCCEVSIEYLIAYNYTKSCILLDRFDSWPKVITSKAADILIEYASVLVLP